MRDHLKSLLGLPHGPEGLEPLGPGSQWRLRGWCAEFADRSTERGYQAYCQHFTARQLLLALGTWSLLLLFAIPDYLAMGWSAPFQGLLAMRVGVALCVLALMRAVVRKPWLATQGLWTSVVELIGLASFMLVYVLRPEIAIWTYAMTLLMLIMLFVFVPNRLCCALAVSLVGALFTLAMVSQSRSLQTREFVILSLALALPIVTGYVSAWRVQMLQRQQYALLMAARASNDQLRQEVEQRRALQEALRIQASIDPLTGLNNRREYEKRFTHEMARARREGCAMSLVMLDLDHFKHINDDHGHAAGDEVLRRVAQLCRENFREVDIAGRLGGEEFVVLMPHTALREAGEVARRFLQVLSDTEIAFEGLRLRVQATAGVAELQAHEDHLETLLQRADHALYAGKQTGRNRVMLALPDGQVQHYQGGAMAPKEPGV
jgi:diguanylate cyclase (GGDEF)-like protein